MARMRARGRACGRGLASSAMRVRSALAPGPISKKEMHPAAAAAPMPSSYTRFRTWSEFMEPYPSELYSSVMDLLSPGSSPSFAA